MATFEYLDYFANEMIVPAITSCFVLFFVCFFGKSILQVPDTGTRVLDNYTRPFLHSSITNF